MESCPKTLNSALLRAQEIEKVEKELEESKNLGMVEDDDDTDNSSSDNDDDNNSFDSMDENYDDNSKEVTP